MTEEQKQERAEIELMMEDVPCYDLVRETYVD